MPDNQAPTVNHAADARFVPGLRPYHEYRDLGVATATGGAFHAHVIRAREAMHGSSGKHRHTLQFQMVYILKGSTTVDFSGYGVVHLKAGDSMVQPPGVAHEVLEGSADLEILEITSPAEFGTEELTT